MLSTLKIEQNLKLEKLSKYLSMIRDAVVNNAKDIKY